MIWHGYEIYFGHEDGLPSFSFPIGWATKYFFKGSQKNLATETN